MMSSGYELFLQSLLGVLGLLHASAAWSYFSKERGAVPWTVAWLLLTGGTIYGLPGYPVVSISAFGVCLWLWTRWWTGIEALAKRHWVPEVEFQATGEITGEQLTVRNVRNFDWLGKHDYVQRWETRTYELGSLEAVDLFVCCWGDRRVAHLIVSFVFSNALSLAFSFETRRETTERWTMIAGFMKSYELSLIAADERDVVRVRTNLRHERVWRYRLQLSAAMCRSLLRQYVGQMNDIARRPRFYNTLFRNCSTEVAQIVQAAGLRLPRNWRLLLPGFVPIYLHELGLIDNRQPFAVIEAQAEVGAAAQAADRDPAFSQRIRQGAAQ